MGNPTKTESEQMLEIEALKKKVLELEQSVREHKRVEAELRLFKEQQELLINGCPDFFFLKDLTLRYQLVNDSNAKFFDREAADILGKTDMELMPEEAVAACRESDLNAIRTGKAVVTIEPVADRVYETRKFPAIIGGEIVGVAGIVRDITEQQHVLDVAKQSVSLLNAALESTADGLLIVEHATGRIAGYNRKFLELWHISESVAKAGNDAELLESVLSQLKHPDVFLQKVASLYADPEVQSFDTIEFRDGRVFERYSQPQKIGSLVVGRVWSFRDITERKRAEDALKSQFQFLKDMTDTIPNPVFYKDLNGVYQGCNKAFAEYVGLSQADIVGKSVFEVHPDDVAETYSKKDADLLSHPGTQTYETIIRHSSGAERNIIISKATYSDGAGQSAGLIGVMVDITERKRAEERIRESEMQLRQIIDLVPHMIFVKDWDGRYLLVNQAVAQGYNKSVGELEGKLHSDFHPEDDELRHMLQDDREVMEKGETKIIEEETYTDAFGVQRFLQTTKVPFHMSGQTRAVLGVAVDITAHKRAEDALRESENRLRIILDSVQTGIVIVDPETHRIVHANPAALNLIGAPAEKVEGSVCHQFICPAEEGQCPITDLRQIIDNSERVLLTAMGETRSIIKTVAHVTLNNRTHLLESFFDITERKRAEDALRASHQRVLDIIEFLPDPTFVIDRERKVVAWNKAIEEMTGVRKENIVGKGDYSYAAAFYGKPRPVLVDLVFERREGDTKEHNNLVGREGILVAEEYVPLIGRGKKAYLSIMASPLFDPGGNVVGAIESVRDITEQKRVEEELQESEERYRTAIESSDDGIAMIKEGRHLYVNRRYLEIFGLSCVDEVLGQPVGFMVHPDDYERVTELAGQRQRNEEAPRRYEFRALKANGDKAFIEVSATRSAFKGEPIVLAYLRDVTARKHLEAQLLQSQKMEAIGTLAGGIAHDFNNILTAVIGYSSLVRMKMEPDSVLKVYLDQILSSSQKAAQLTQNLLAFSRKQAIELKAKKVDAMVRESEKLLKRLLMENIEFKLSLAAPDVTIMADPIQIDQVLMNLAANARDAMPQGGSFTITTSAICLDEQFSKAHGFGEPGDYAVISVIDSGVGINPQILAKVFEPFFTTKEVGKGTGLGLSTVYGIVKQHNGYITVQSSPGEGTTFTIYFPRIYVSVGRERSAPYKIEKGNETVLVAEDDEEVRGLLKEILEGSGYTVLEAVDGEDAVVQFRLHGKIDLLIFDSVMPRKNGREAYNEIRMMSPGVKAILTSGYAEEIVLGDGIEDSNLSFVSKPISPNELLHKVRVMLDK